MHLKVVPVIGRLRVDANLAPPHEVLVAGFPVRWALGNFIACVGPWRAMVMGVKRGDLKVSPFCRELIMQHLL